MPALAPHPTLANPSMQRITVQTAHPLFTVTATRAIEQAAACVLPQHTLMQRAGLAVARLAQALAPHARTVWIACGAGNNGGDGLEAAAQLQATGRKVIVTWLGSPDHAPADALAAFHRAMASGVAWSTEPPGDWATIDLCVDALLGIGLSSSTQALNRNPDARLQTCLGALQRSTAPVLAVDVPSGLDADTGKFAPGFASASGATGAGGPRRTPANTSQRYTLSLLTLKPGLFTADGRDASGQVWFDDLGVTLPGAPSAWLCGPGTQAPRAHASHKGSYGDVAVVGGEGLSLRGMGMTGAALLAASAALHSGAGRVLVALLDDGQQPFAVQQPELMFRRFDALDLERLTVVCGCGGGIAVVRVLPDVLHRAHQLVLDADALNAIASDGQLEDLLVARGLRAQVTVLTPHPLEAARLLRCTTADVQADRMAAAVQLAERFRCVVVLKGSGTVIAGPGLVPGINPTGNARLATAGTGDVLAGMLGAYLACLSVALGELQRAIGGVGRAAPPIRDGETLTHRAPSTLADADEPHPRSEAVDAWEAACAAVHAHGLAADRWPGGTALTARALAEKL